MKWAGIIIGVLIIIILIIVIIRTLMFQAKQIGNVKKVEIDLDKNALARHLSGAIQYRTISQDDPEKIDKNQFLAFHGYLRKTFPKLHKKLKLEKINNLSLLYKWDGADKNLKPIIILAHQDVVPVEDDKVGASKWRHPPFSGALADGYITVTALHYNMTHFEKTRELNLIQW